MKTRRKVRPKLTLALLAVWRGVGAAVGTSLSGVASRPANPMAHRLTLRPHSGSFGPFQLWATDLPGGLEGGDSGILMVSTDPPGGGGTSLMITVPSLQSAVTSDAAGGRPVGMATLTPDRFALQVLGRPQPASPQVTAGLAELWSLVRTAERGMSTRLRHFEVVAAEPWESARWFRRRRRASTVAVMVLAWLAVAGAIWRRRPDARVPGQPDQSVQPAGEAP